MFLTYHIIFALFAVPAPHSLLPSPHRARARSFVQMATAVAILSGHCPSWDLVAFSFDVYDFNGDGVIDFNELRDMLANSLAERGIPHRCGVFSFSNLFFSFFNPPGLRFS
jgi:hypothetical protein